MKKDQIITLTTDFGLSDCCVASMKAVIKSICPAVTIIDVTHDVPAFDIRSGAFQIGNSFSFFPKGTIHVGVIDPGVGSERLPILVRTRNHDFIGPDNGLVTLLAKRDLVRSVHCLDKSNYHLNNVSHTFHGRDIFAPMAAYLAMGMTAQKLGKKVTTFKKLSCFETSRDSKKLKGEIICIDHFGNATTNISGEEFLKFTRKKEFTASVAQKNLKKLCSTFSYVSKGKPVLIIGSSGFVEFAANQASIAKKWRLRLGQKVTVKI